MRSLVCPCEITELEYSSYVCLTASTAHCYASEPYNRLGYIIICINLDLYCVYNEISNGNIQKC